MDKYRLTHDELGPVLINLTAQTFQRIPDTRNTFKGRFRAFDSLSDFLQSEHESAVIPFFCIKFEEKGKRHFVEILTGNEQYKFWNVEKLNGKWEQNAITMVDPHSAYFGFFKRARGSDNDCIIQSVMKIEKK